MNDCIFIRVGKKNVRVNLPDILYVEAMRNYIHIVTRQKEFTPLIQLRVIEQHLPAPLFCKVHRSFIISLNYINSFDCNTVTVGDREIPVAPQYRTILPSRLTVIQSDVRHLTMAQLL